jgi:hemolysin activation/secretion protein
MKMSEDKGRDFHFYGNDKIGTRHDGKSAIKNGRVFGKTVFLFGIFCSVLFGYDEGIESAKPPQELRTEPNELVIIEQNSKEAVLEDGGRIFIRDFSIEGAEDGSSYDDILSSYKGKELNMREINEAVSKITAEYRKKGYLTASAFVPKQNIENDILKIVIVIGKYGTISYDNQSPIKEFIIQSTLEKTLKKGEYVTSSSLERAMLLVNDMAGTDLPEVAIFAGEEFGSSDFNFDLHTAKRLDGYVTGDNYGSRLTGKQRLSLGLDVNSPFGLSDRISLSGVQSKGAELQDGRVAYAFLLYSNGLKGEISAEKTDYELGQEYKDLEAIGTAKVLSASLTYPFIRTQLENLYTKVSFSKKDMEDKIQVLNNIIPKEINVASFGLSYEKYTTLFGLNAFYTVGGNVNFGKLKITDEKESELNKKGVNTVGSYRKADITFLGSVALSDSFTLMGNIRAQKAFGGKNLDGSEQISISGVNSVRAYPDSEYSSDSGYIAGLELDYKLPGFVGIAHNAGVFFDMGRGFIEDDSYTVTKSRTLSDIGLSYHVRYKGLFAKVQAARIVGSEKVLSEDDYETRYLCQVGMVF